MTPPVMQKSWDYVAELLAHLAVPAERVRLSPTPGTAAEADLLEVSERTGRLFELVDATLVEKPMGAKEGGLGGEIGYFINAHIRPLRLGAVFGADTPYRLMTGVVRLPDVSFVKAERLPGGCYPDEAITDIYPDLAVEVLSRSNTPAEMERKVWEYFFAGTSLVWIVDPVKRTVRVHTSPDGTTLLTETDTLDGGTVLPGFALALTDLFARIRRA